MKPCVVDLSVKEQLAAIPKAQAGMDAETLRRICIALFRLQLSFPYVPSESYQYEIRSRKIKRSLPQDAVLGGLPYVCVGGGSIYRAMEHYDEKTGVLDVAPFRENPKLFGNACSGSSCIAWSRVVSSAKMDYTGQMTKFNGYLPVGPYTYPEDLQAFVKGKENPEENYTPADVCRENGEQIMFESYAALLPADGLVNPTHVRMNVFRPRVFRNEDGSINGEKSYTVYMHQHIPYTPGTQRDGSPIKVQGGVDVKVTFQNLFEDGYIPFTFAEFCGKAEVMPPKASLVPAEKAYTVEQFLASRIDANYNISDVYVTLNGEGMKVKKYRYENDSFVCRSLSVKKILSGEFFRENLPAEACQMTVSCRLFSGDTVTAFCGEIKP